jgi:hypothetical protein
MKKIVLLVGILVSSYSVMAQITTPQPSPAAKVEQTVGLTEVHIEYSRPAVRGREVFGNLVPFGKTWRTGANANAKITFTDDVKVGGSDVKKGTYAIYTVPNAESWDLLLYADATNWGTPEKWDDSKVVAKATSSVVKLPFTVESFTLAVHNISSNGADLTVMWADTAVAFPFEVPTKAKTLASIEKAMAGPQANDYFSAAGFYYAENMKLDEALVMIDKAVAAKGDEAYWYIRLQSLINAKLGNKKAAIAAAKRSLASAKKANNADYVKMNEDSLKEWGAK